MSPAAEEPNNGAPASQLSLSTLAIHSDDVLNVIPDVAPALHVSTTFRYSKASDKLVPIFNSGAPRSNTDPHIYSRDTAPNSTRLEAILSSLLSGHALTYSSGLASFFALLTHFRPRVIAIAGGYHGCHGVINVHNRLTGLRSVDLFSPDQAAWDEAGLGKGDIVHVETPLNPTGEARDLAYFAELAHKRGAILTVDATFGPPPLQDPFALGADVVMHSGTKYIGGHSDMLCGVLVVQKREWWDGLLQERLFLGSVLGSLEGWLGVRSLRTLELRVRRQSESATSLVGWLDACLVGAEGVDEEEKKVVQKVVAGVQHASLQAREKENAWLLKQMPNGYGPVFALSLKNMEMARSLPGKLELFHHATSLGGVESLIEWRRMTDSTVDERLLRVSVGVEGWEDLRRDLLQGLKAVADLH